MPERYPVVIIDDSADDLVLLRRALTKTGVASAIFPFEDPLAAMRFLRSFASTHAPGSPDPIVVLCDLKMTGKTGFDVLHWIRGQPFSANLRVLLVSGAAGEEDIERARALGADGFLDKIPSVDELHAAMLHPVFPAAARA